MKKRHLFFLVLLSFCLCACGKVYADGIGCVPLADAAVDAAPDEFGYETFGTEHLTYYFGGTDLPDHFCMRYSTRAEDINEIGVFHCRDEDRAKKMLRLTEDYLVGLKNEKSAFIASYAPEELPKLESAEARRFGNYVVYAILSDQDREAVFRTVEGMLR